LSGGSATPQPAPAARASADVAVQTALAQLGKPYQWGGSGPNSFDCSGLTSYAWRAAGVTLPRTSGAQYAGTRRISRAELQPGDLVFYHSPISHVAMYIGNGQVVEAPNSGNNVRIRSDGLTRRGIVGFGRP
jgi:peptidoglycan DL-endopeptidase CwlO